MKKLISLFGYTVALLAVPLILAAFIGMDFWSAGLVDALGLKVSARYTGGEVVRTVDKGDYEIMIHREVFDGLFADRKQGMLQVDWTPEDKLPKVVTEDIDYNNDGIKDFSIEIDKTKYTARLKASSSKVVKVIGCYRLKDKLAVRVELKR